MLVQLITDAEGANPDYAPPADACARQAYSVPQTVTIPAGTILPEDPLAWVHCFPRSLHFVDQRTQKPMRGGSALGPVIAIPADDQARAAFELNLPGWCASNRLSIDQGRKRIREIVGRAQHAAGCAGNCSLTPESCSP